jgi:hypothetical protein
MRNVLSLTDCTFNMPNTVSGECLRKSSIAAIPSGANVDAVVFTKKRDRRNRMKLINEM